MENLIFDFIAQYMPLSEEEKQAIIDLALIRTCKKGTVLLSEGHPAREGYLVLRGCLRSYYIIDGEDKTTSFYTEFEFFAPAGLVTHKPSQQYLACLEDCILAVGNPDMEKVMFEKFPRFENLCRIISEEILARNQVSFDDFKTSTPEQRYLKLLKNRPDLVQRVPQHQLASYLGITPPSLSRIRKRLVAEAKTLAVNGIQG